MQVNIKCHLFQIKEHLLTIYKEPMALATGPLVYSTFFFFFVTSQKGEFRWERKFFNIKKSYVHNIFTINLLP